MKRIRILVSTSILCIFATTACENLDQGLALSAAADLFQASQISDEQVKSLSSQAAKEYDSENQVAAPSSPYVKRLDTIVSPHVNESGMSLDFKVYETKDINAFAMADGTVRVYSGLMDLMTDDELLFVLGHEIGHVELGHSKKKIQVAYAASAARKGAAAGGGTIGQLAGSEIGGFCESLLNAQFSQSEELEADQYSLRFMSRHQYPATAAVSALEKLGGGASSFLSSHPDSKKRARLIQDEINKRGG